MITTVRMSLALAVASTLLTIIPSAHATITISSCGATCPGGSQCVLGQDLTCTSGNGVTLQTASTLDMHGHSIGCAADFICDTAVKMTGGGPGGQVFTSVGGASPPTVGTTMITGGWLYGVDCADGAQSFAQSITFEGAFAYAVINRCTFTLYNVITGFPFASGFDNGGDVRYPIVSAIGVYFVGANDPNGGEILTNYIDGVVRPIVRSPISPNTKLAIEMNVINHRNYSPGISQPSAITLVSDSNHPQQEGVTGNLVTGDGGGVIAVTSNHANTYGGNVCKFPLAGCHACVTAGQCVASTTITSP